jgi:thioredoxin-dependent adenylylsulfate APS reductase
MVSTNASAVLHDAPLHHECDFPHEVYEAMTAQEVIGWTLGKFGHRAALVTSFQADGMVIIDMAHRIDPNVRIVTVDTGRLPKETHELIDRVRDRYGIQVEVQCPSTADISNLVTKHGSNPFYRSVSLRMMCCDIRKVAPLDSALQGFDAWISGLRRGQSLTRVNTPRVEIDGNHGGIMKVNPLADWSNDEVWDYIRANDVPYNQLYDQGYTSIGCAPCTRAIEPGEDQRAGRWWWETSSTPKECGIHLSPAVRKAMAAAALPNGSST